MSIIGSRVLGGAGQQPYLVGRSLRFRSSASAYLNRTPASAGNRKTWTWSGWIKLGALTSGFSFIDQYSDANNQSQARIRADGVLRFYDLTSNVFTTDIYWTPVYRDPSAWYHIMLVADTSQATNTNRVKFYVNGTQVTSTSSATWPSQNTDLRINLNAQHFIGQNGAGGEYADGYLAEVNFIDGQALTPSSFGAYDNNGVWQPSKYGGTYGTNGFYLPFSINTTSTYGGSFNGSSQSLSGTLSSAVGSGNFTIEGWVNQNTLTNYQTWFAITRGANGFNIGTDAAGTLVFYSSGARQIAVAGIVKTNQWQHFAFVRNGTTLTAYLNGVSQGTATVSTNFSATGFFIGSLDNTQEWVNALMSNLRLTNTAVYTSNFTPPTQPLTAVTGSVLLTLQSSTIVDNSGNSTTINNTGSVTTSVQYPFNLASSISNDASGNGNNWTANNISLNNGTTYDSMIDSPTVSASSSNYCVLNPLIQRWAVNAGVFSEGNLKITTTNASSSFGFGTTFVSTGKWYWEGTMVAIGTATPGFGVGDNQCQSGTFTNLIEYNRDGSRTGGAAWATYTTNDVISVAMDCDNRLIYFYKNNVLQGSISLTSGVSYAPIADVVLNAIWAVNFGQRPFTYTPPSGFNALNTYNLPQPTIMNGAKYMQATLYTGNGSATQTIAQSVTGNSATFLPDFVWTKGRSGATNNIQIDTVRGGANYLISDSTSAEAYNAAAAIQSFSSNGYVIGNGGAVNTNAATYVSWQWNAGSGTTSTNTSGSISSLVSVNASAGFSIVSYVGNGTAGATVGHSLGVAPSMYIIKRRNAAEAWGVYHTSLGATKAINLELTAAAYTYSIAWNDTAPTSNVFSLGTWAAVNSSLGSFIAYCWSAVAGYSAFGSYTGNGSADGPFIYTGFRPRWVMIKRTDVANDWFVLDSSRDTYNVVQNRLCPDLSNAEGSGTAFYLDFLSNGIKIRSSDSIYNASSGTYIYAAFAENPFKISRAR